MFVCRHIRKHTGKHAFVSCMYAPLLVLISHNVIILIILTNLCTNLLNDRRYAAVLIRSSLFLHAQVQAVTWSQIVCMHG